MNMTIEGKDVTIFPSGIGGTPLIILNAVDDEGEQVWKAASSISGYPFSLAVISGLDWNRDLSPWPSSAVFRDSADFSGGADAYLDVLSSSIIPRVVDSLGSEPGYIAIAGYSLAGLFALYAMYRTTLFSRFASVSGSLWYPGFREYVEGHVPLCRPDAVYLSLGDREARTRNTVMQSVERNTVELAVHYRDIGVDTFFELNEGNHFRDPIGRTVRGMAWLLGDHR